MTKFKIVFQELDKQESEQIYIAPMYQTIFYDAKDAHEALNRFKEEYNINNIISIQISKEKENG